MADFRYELRDGGCMATIMARRGVKPGAIGALLGADAADQPGETAGSEGLRLIGTGAGTWLAQAEGASPTRAGDLAARLAGKAAVSDQSGAYVVFRLSGADARTVLQRGVPIDLHPAAFGAGAAAVTAIAYISVILWTVDGGAFDVAVYRSFAGSFEDWLAHAAAAL